MFVFIFRVPRGEPFGNPGIPDDGEGSGHLGGGLQGRKAPIHGRRALRGGASDLRQTLGRVGTSEEMHSHVSKMPH